MMTLTWPSIMYEHAMSIKAWKRGQTRSTFKLFDNVQRIELSLKRRKKRALESNSII